MPLLRITADADGLRPVDSARTWRDALAHGLTADPGPVTLMVHGYKYQPGHPVHCPHNTLLSDNPRHQGGRIKPWPRHLGLRGQRGEGLGISFGWSARGSIWAAHARAAEAGSRMADLLGTVRDIDPDRAVHVVGHSLGARVTLQAIGAGNTGTVQRAILLAGAEYGGTARDILASDAGRATQVLNVTSRENDLFDFLMERLVAPAQPGDRMLGHGQVRLANLVTLQLDDTASLAALHAAGYPIAAPRQRICHWSPYLRAGVFPLYRAVLSGAMPLSRLRLLLPSDCAPRWSRLMPRVPAWRPQPPGQAAAR